jgi:hypothetical protein
MRDSCQIETFNAQSVPASGGAAKTIEFAHKHNKSCHVADIKSGWRKPIVDHIVPWLQGEIEEAEWPKPPKDVVLNIAGPRESKVSGIEWAVQILMVDVLTRTNPARRSIYPLRDKGSLLREPVSRS